MSDNFVWISVLVSLLTILYVWYVTNKMRSVTHLHLDTDEDKILSKWFDSNIKPGYQFDLDDHKVASMYLQNIYDIKVNDRLIVTGKNLLNQHPKLSRQYSPKKDCIFYMRDVLGIDIEIAIIHDKYKRDSICQEGFDYHRVYNIISCDAGIKSRDFLQNTLKNRWNAIEKLEDPTVINSFGSYLYIKSEEKELFNDSVLGAITPFGTRVNLLCTDLEFDILIKRWKKSLDGLAVKWI